MEKIIDLTMEDIIDLAGGTPSPTPPPSLSPPVCYSCCG